MAEIRVEQKRGLGWLWALIALIVVVLLIWFFMAGADEEVEPMTPVTEPVGSSISPTPDPYAAVPRLVA